MYEEARQFLRKLRLQAGLSQLELAKRAHSSEAAIRSYESLNTGRQRTPSREHLEAILHELYAPRDETAWVMEGFGYSTTHTLYPPDRFPGYSFSAEELQPHIERVPWPCFVVNTAVDIVAANTAAERLWGVTLAEERARATSGEANVLAVASHPRIGGRIANWDECVAVMVGVFKGQPEQPEHLDRPSERFRKVLEDFARGEPALVARLGELWERTPPLSAKVRWAYPVVWRDPVVGEIRFHAIVSAASEAAGLAFNDWHPRDGESWIRFEALTHGATQE